jgi:Cof subfamily protein (haloacid dehalogenase superfamily)
MNASNMQATQKISLLVSDVDGTLVTRDKVLTERAGKAVQRLYEAGIKFAITSSRPPAGMKMFVEALKLSSPLGAYNGGMLVQPDMTIMSEKTLPRSVAEGIVKILTDHSLGIWVYVGNEWYVLSERGAHVEREEFVIQKAPVMVTGFDQIVGLPAKIVGVSDDYPLVERCEAAVQKRYSTQASASRSQPYYLDITNPQANKGVFVQTLMDLFGLDASTVATIGDGANDISMFKQSGISIAMGNGSEEVKQRATYVTETNEEEGFASAVEKFILGALVSP